MLPALDVAKYYLSIVDDEDEYLSHLKLQKLLYYAQGLHLAMTGTPLFGEAILAWAHGPVVREVWDTYKNYGANSIPPSPDLPNISHGTTDILDEVWRVYGQFSAWRLREISHESPPWRDVSLNDVIPHAAMQRYFKTQLIEN